MAACRRPRLPRRHRMFRVMASSLGWFRACRALWPFRAKHHGAFPPILCRGKETAWRLAGARDCRAGTAWFALRHCPSNGFGRAACRALRPFRAKRAALCRPPFAGVRKPHDGLPAPAIAAQAPHVSRHGIVLRMVSGGLRIAAFSRGAFISTLFQWFAPGSAPNAFRFEQHKAQDPAFSFSAS